MVPRYCRFFLVILAFFPFFDSNGFEGKKVLVLSEINKEIEEFVGWEVVDLSYYDVASGLVKAQQQAGILGQSLCMYPISILDINDFPKQIKLVHRSLQLSQLIGESCPKNAPMDSIEFNGKSNTEITEELEIIFTWSNLLLGTSVRQEKALKYFPWYRRHFDTEYKTIIDMIQARQSKGEISSITPFGEFTYLVDGKLGNLKVTFNVSVQEDCLIINDISTPM
jgi:hypothetical protein